MTLQVRDSRSSKVLHLAVGILVNAAGLQAQEVAAVLKGLPAQHVPKRHLARGCYFSLSGCLIRLWPPCALSAASCLLQYSAQPLLRGVQDRHSGLSGVSPHAVSVLCKADALLYCSNGACSVVCS